MRGRIALLVVSALLSGGVPAALAKEPAPEPRTTLPDVEDEVMCPICGVPLELATEAPQAERERVFIRHLIAQGLTKEEIKDRLVDEYGEEVLAEPGTEGFDLAAWLVPGAAILLAAGAIAAGLWRWRRSGPGDGGDAPPRATAPLDPADAKRLEADLGRYEL